MPPVISVIGRICSLYGVSGYRRLDKLQCLRQRLPQHVSKPSGNSRSRLTQFSWTGRILNYFLISLVEERSRCSHELLCLLIEFFLNRSRPIVLSYDTSGRVTVSLICRAITSEADCRLPYNPGCFNFCVDIFDKSTTVTILGQRYLWQVPAIYLDGSGFLWMRRQSSVFFLSKRQSSLRLCS